MEIPIRNSQEIKIIRRGGCRLAKIMRQLLKEIEPGVSLEKLDRLAELLIGKEGGKPSFKMVKDYHWATCLNINQGVVHGIPNQYQLRVGDLLSLDIGIFYQGFHTDMARSVKVKGKNDPSTSLGVNDRVKEKFLEAGEEALKEAIQLAKPGNRVGHLSAAIEGEIRKAGYRPIEALTGHGVGRNLHEEPQIPCFLKGKIESTPRLKPGMVLAIEVIYAQGNPEIALEDDGWTIETADGSLGGLFENTVVVTKDGSEILTA